MQIHSCSNSSPYSGETCQQTWCINSCVTEAETLMLAKHTTINHRGFTKTWRRWAARTLTCAWRWVSTRGELKFLWARLKRFSHRQTFLTVSLFLPFCIRCFEIPRQASYEGKMKEHGQTPICTISFLLSRIKANSNTFTHIHLVQSMELLSST